MRSYKSKIIIFVSFMLLFVMLFCEKKENTKKPVDYVNPFMGTKGEGNIIPGALSTWYVFAAMGFYPVYPGSNNYVITSPVFSHIIIDNGNKNGMTFQIKAEKSSKENKYIQSAMLNGLQLENPWISHSDISNSGTLVLTMGATPNKKWGSLLENTPPSLSKPYLFML